MKTFILIALLGLLVFQVSDVTADQAETCRAALGQRCDKDSSGVCPEGCRMTCNQNSNWVCQFDSDIVAPPEE